MIKLKKIINLYNLITKDDKEIVIAYSGGKDLFLMYDFLYEYKKRNHLSLELKLLEGKFPKFLFNIKNKMKMHKIKDAFVYWRQKGFSIKNLNYTDELATYNCYDRIVKFIKESNLVSSVEELNHYMSNSLMV